MKKLSLGKLKISSEEVLQRDQLATIYGGSGSGSLSHCTSLYLVRTCNGSMSEGSATGWSYGWSQASCSQQGAAHYWDEAVSAGLDMSNCTNTNWYPY